jgi:hypothetical protein
MVVGFPILLNILINNINHVKINTEYYQNCEDFFLGLKLLNLRLRSAMPFPLKYIEDSIYINVCKYLKNMTRLSGLLVKSPKQKSIGNN